MNRPHIAALLRVIADEAARTVRDEAVDADSWALLVEVATLLRQRADEIESQCK